MGGVLVVPFLCSRCNSRLGTRVEAAARSDPSVRIAAYNLADRLPSLAKTLAERQAYIADSVPGRVRGHVKNDEFRVRSTQAPDESLILPTPDAREAIATILRRAGFDAPFRNDAIRLFDEADENTRVRLAPGLEVVKWSIAKLEPLLEGPLMDPVVPLKIAFEFLACHLGTAVYDEAAPLKEIRRTLNGAVVNAAHVTVERLHAQNYEPFHGIVFEGNEPHSRVQIRLFGWLAFRVHFLQLAIGGPRFEYTHNLASGREHLRLVGREADE